MFCYHCQEAKKNIACDTAGICGKKADISSLHDLLTYALKGLSLIAQQATELGIQQPLIDQFTARALYAMVTNVNFDATVFVQLITETVQRREHLKRLILVIEPDYVVENDVAVWHYDSIELKDFVSKGESVGVMPEEALEGVEVDLHAAREMLVYAAKGLGALIEHIQVLEPVDAQHYHFLYKILADSLDNSASLDDLLAINFSCGQEALMLMARLAGINAQRFGVPEPTTVHIDTSDKPAILISGHDYQDLQDLLEQSAGSGVDIYTHGEMMAAHSYPAFKKYFNLVANYGGAWQDQKTQFGKFNGPVLITSNSFQQPKKGYIDKAYTTGMVGWSDIKHIDKRRGDNAKDFTAIIEQAKQCEPPTGLTEGSVNTGYGEQALIALADKIIAALNQGDIKRIVVIAGYDGRHKERRYYTQLVEALSPDTLIITAGDTKYRFNQLELGDINGIPRLLDVGQAHDFYAIIKFLEHLATQLNLKLNELPVSFNIAWYEQQTILMMLALFSKGIKNVRIGPTLPPFFSAGILEMLEQTELIKAIDTPENDSAAILAGL